MSASHFLGSQVHASVPSFPQTLFLFLIISGLFGPALEAIGVTGDSDEVLNRIANSVVNPTPQWLQPDKSDDKGMP